MSRSAISRMSVASLALFAILALPSFARAEDDGFSAIFNGKDTTDWVVDAAATYKDKEKKEHPTWTVEEGMLVCADGAGFGFIRYDKKQYTDFCLRTEYRMSKNCNSGVGIRTPVYKGNTETRPSHASYEIQIFDDAGKKPDIHSHAALYNYVAPTSNAGKSASEWQSLEIDCRGPKIKVTLNGSVVQDFDQTTNKETKDKPLSGYVCLQNHGHKIEFRSVKIKEFPAASEKGG